jgi:ATP-dependent DNA ligase
MPSKSRHRPVDKHRRVTLQSRNRTTMSTWFPELAPIAELVDDAVIDGEIIL